MLETHADSCRALLTRNTLKAVAYFHKNHFSSLPPFAPAVARDFGLPPKPDPAAILHICRVILFTDITLKTCTA